MFDHLLIQHVQNDDFQTRKFTSRKSPTGSPNWSPTADLLFFCSDRSGRDALARVDSVESRVPSHGDAKRAICGGSSAQSGSTFAGGNAWVRLGMGKWDKMGGINAKNDDQTRN